MSSPTRLFCSNCGINLTDNPDKKKCSNCKLVYYCNPKCQKKDWSSHKKVCKKKIELGEDIVFMLGHSRLEEEVFRLPSDVTILTYNKCGTPLESQITMDECLTADRCERGLKPHIYLGSNNDVIMDMYYNFEPLVKFNFDGKMFTSRDIFTLVGFKLISEDTSMDLMGFREQDYDDFYIFSKFYHWKETNVDYNERIDSHMEKEIQKFKSYPSESTIKRLVSEFDEKEYQKYLKSGESKKVKYGVEENDEKLFLLSELFVRKMVGKKTKTSKEDKEKIRTFFKDREYKVRLSEIIKFITENSNLRTFSVNGCRSFPSYQQSREVLSKKLFSKPKRMNSNRNSKPIENSRFRYTHKDFINNSIPPLTPVPLGEYLDKKGKILGMLPERMNRSGVRGRKTKKKKKNR